MGLGVVSVWQCNIHSSVWTVGNLLLSMQDRKTLRDYIAYARVLKPRLGDEAGQMLIHAYVGESSLCIDFQLMLDRTQSIKVVEFMPPPNVGSSLGCLRIIAWHLKVLTDWVKMCWSAIVFLLSRGLVFDCYVVLMYGSIIVSVVEMRKIGSQRGSVSAYPRQLESLIRLSEAHAKMRLSDVVEPVDVDEAKRWVSLCLGLLD